MKYSKLLLILLSICLVACLGDKAPDTPDTPDTSDSPNPITVQQVGSAVEDCDQPLASYTNFQQVYNECISWDEGEDKGTLEVKYRSDDANLTGLGITIHYNSMEIQFTEFYEFFTKDLIDAVAPNNDVDDLDNDPSTDKFLNISWASLVSPAEWPGDEYISEQTNLAEITLVKINFNRNNNTENYIINYSRTSNAATANLILGK
ncbi:hypothetical protein N9I32_01715 [Porticoccaceae bacterium]|nr:hypothetical protein [Porticoccaceae bacterium]